MKTFIGGFIGFAFAFSVGFVLDHYKIGHGTAFPALGGMSMGAFFSLTGAAAAKTLWGNK